MKVLLIAPPWLDIYGYYSRAARLGCVAQPLGLMYLGGALAAAGAQCRIVDMQSQAIDLPGLLEIVREYQPDLCGLTATTPVFHNAERLAAELKTRFPAVPIGIGGVHSTVMGVQLLRQYRQFDFQVVGEGESAIQEIVEAFCAGRDLHGIAGVYYRRDGEILMNAPRELTQDLDRVPQPDRRLLDPDLFQHCLPGKRFVKYAGLFTSRGCPFQCVFCSQHTMYGRHVRWHSIERVMAELDCIVNELGIGHVIFMDETLTLNKRRLLDICGEIKRRGLSFTWEGWTHVATINEEVLRAMKQAGLIRLSFGIESGDPEILKRIKKGITLDQVREAYRLAGELEIETRGSAMLGHPYETRETAWRTIKFIRSLRGCQQMHLNIACPYPGTELYEQACKGEAGLRLLTTDYSRYQRYGEPVIEVNDLTARDLKRLQTLGLLYFYCTPGRILYNLVQRAGIKAGLRNALAFLSGIVSSMLGRRRSAAAK